MEFFEYIRIATVYCSLHTFSPADALVEVSAESVEGDEGTDLSDSVCASLIVVSSTQPILKDIEFSFELVPGSAGECNVNSIIVIMTR